MQHPGLLVFAITNQKQQIVGQAEPSCNSRIDRYYFNPQYLTPELYQEMRMGLEELRGGQYIKGQAMEPYSYSYSGPGSSGTTTVTPHNYVSKWSNTPVQSNSALMLLNNIYSGYYDASNSALGNYQVRAEISVQSIDPIPGPIEVYWYTINEE